MMSYRQASAPAKSAPRLATRPASFVSRESSPLASNAAEIIDTRPVADNAARRGTYVHSGAKRALDIILATTLFIATLPVMLIIALLVKTTSKGPVIFKQQRNGVGGFFHIYKFRTMYDRPDEVVGGFLKQACRGDSRVTPVGYWLRRLSLDELPQIINVLQGKMSVVGPRPHALSHDEYYSQHITNYMMRYDCRPGITGLAQVSGARGETDTHEQMSLRVNFDLEYIERASVLMDLKLILRTALMILNSKNVY